MVNGFIVLCKNSNVLADHMLRILEDMKLQKDIGERNLLISRESAA